MVKLILLPIIITYFLVLALGCNGSVPTGEYNKITSFSENKPIKYPDFELTYIGERKQTSTFPNGNSFTFTYYDFKVRNEKEEKTVSWTTGTGVIEPVNFEINGMKFMLELRYWEKEKKKLDEDVLVVTKL